MKNVFKIATISALVMLSANSMAATVGVDAASGNFQWVGTVAPVNVGATDFEIVQAGTVDHDKGTLTFANESGVISISGSSELAFDVVQTVAGAAPGTPMVSYDYELSTLKFSTGGSLLASDDANEFVVNAVSSIGNAPLVIGTPVVGATGATKLSLESKAGGFTPGVVAEGDEVIVQASILVSNAV
ncbi:hypothetical protein [Shewanella sp.]|uniref:hypothetical protein n=1 Tax=Shewanella sp. TaxID=50422 RepID=UPI00258C359D|nr:hypothetical protein [Shewanella sp.]MCJ8303306.1 hypothetical protein [Shewanella sp.]